MNFKNVLVGLAVALSLGFAGDRIHKFYYKNFPVVEVGECVSLEVQPGSPRHVLGLVLDNNNKEHSSFLIVEIQPGIGIPLALEYSAMRDLHAKKVGCDEKVN